MTEKFQAPQPAPVVPDNLLAGTVCTVAEARGYVAFGAGVYKITQTGDEPGLVVTFRSPRERHHGVGDLAPEVDLTPIQPEDIIVRLQFTSAAGLDSLEHHLREIRNDHWPETIPAPEGGRDLRTAFESWALQTPPDDRTNWEVFQAGARAALAAQPQQAAGHKLAPLEPTPQMRKAAADAWLDCDSKLILNKAAAALRAGIAAAPTEQS